MREHGHAYTCTHTRTHACEVSRDHQPRAVIHPAPRPFWRPSGREALVAKNPPDRGSAGESRRGSLVQARTLGLDFGILRRLRLSAGSRPTLTAEASRSVTDHAPECPRRARDQVPTISLQTSFFLFLFLKTRKRKRNKIVSHAPSACFSFSERKRTIRSSPVLPTAFTFKRKRENTDEKKRSANWTDRHGGYTDHCRVFRG